MTHFTYINTFTHKHTHNCKVAYTQTLEDNDNGYIMYVNATNQRSKEVNPLCVSNIITQKTHFVGLRSHIFQKHISLFFSKKKYF